MSNKDFSPIASAVIAALLPFVNDEDKQGLNATFATLKSTASEATAKMQEGVSQATSDTETTNDVPTVWALASCKEFYVPFDDRINGMTKDDDKNDIPKITASNQFAKKRGVNPKAFMEIENEIVDAHGKDITEYELNDEGQPVKIGGETETTPEKPNRPAKPGKPGAPSKPNRPAKPGKPVGDSNDKKESIANIQQLVKMGCDYDFVKDNLLAHFEVEGLDDLPAENEAEFKALSKAWVDWLKMIDTIHSQFISWDNESPSGENEGTVDHYLALLEEFGAENMQTLPRESLSEFHGQLEPIHDEWKAYFDGCE